MNNRNALLMISFVAALLVTSFAGAEQQLIQNEHEAKWSDGPAMLPPGAKIDVVQGDPGGTALYTARLNFPANYKIPAHSHPTDEHVTVLSGTLYMGTGDKLDPKGATALTIGGFALMPAKMNVRARRTPGVPARDSIRFRAAASAGATCRADRAGA